jgi:hypothetical protein
MVRVSKNLQGAAKLLLCAALAGCSSGGDDAKEEGLLLAKLISFSPMYSAFDDNMHEYAVTPSVPSAMAGMTNADPIVASSIKWTVDGAFVKQDEFPELTAAIKLTTKKAGDTKVKVSAKTMSGQTVRGETDLKISTAAQSEWDVGEARYNNGMMIQWMRPMMAAPGEGLCGLPIASFDVSTAAACGNCHNPMNAAITVEHTPTQTAGYSNEDLINIFSTGQKPAGAVFNSPLLKMAPMPDCIYAAFHTWDMTDDEKAGIIWKLRSIPPKVQEEIDFGRLRAMAMAAMQAQASGEMPAP